MKIKIAHNKSTNAKFWLLEDGRLQWADGQSWKPEYYMISLTNALKAGRMKNVVWEDWIFGY